MVWTDASASAEPAVEEAAELSVAYGAELIVLLVPPHDLSAEDASSVIEATEALARTYDGKLIVAQGRSAPDIRDVLDAASGADGRDGQGDPSVSPGTALLRASSEDPLDAAVRAAQEERADVLVLPKLARRRSAEGDHPLAADDGTTVSPPEGGRRRSGPTAAVRAFYRDRLAWAALFVTSLALCYGGGAVLFWLHALARGERGPAINDWYHWLLDSTLGFVALTPVLFVILPTALWLVVRGDTGSRLRLWPYAVMLGMLFTLVTGPGPLLHDRIAGHGTWLANFAMRMFGENADVAERNMHAMAHSPVTEGLLQLAVGLPVYVFLAWLALRLVGAATGRRRSRSTRLSRFSRE